MKEIKMIITLTENTKDQQSDDTADSRNVKSPYKKLHHISD